METYRHVSQIINTNLNHTKGLLAPENTPYALPFTFLRGAKPGPSLVVTGGLHSGEYPGVAACARLSQTLSPEDLAGSVLLLHCVNETGFFAHSEALVPEGNVNLNGDFPGDLSGTPGKRLVAFMEQEIIPFADYILDLHSGGGMEPLSPCLFFPVTAGENVLRTSLKMAVATGIEHLVASSAKTGFYSFAAQHGVPGLLLERGYGAMCREEDVSNCCTDVRDVLKTVNMLPGEPENTDKKTVWPKVDYLVAEHKGLWYPTVKKGDILPAGALLGEVRDFWNNPPRRVPHFVRKPRAIPPYRPSAAPRRQPCRLCAHGRSFYIGRLGSHRAAVSLVKINTKRYENEREKNGKRRHCPRLSRKRQDARVVCVVRRRAHRKRRPVF